MIYLEKVILENFQSHKYTEIYLDRELNIIVGQSDSGKTAIIRGIKWTLYNEPSGDYFIRQGETYCSVTLTFSNSTMLKRYRSKSKNYYLLIDIDGQEIKYEGFGTGVPEEIVEKLGIGKINLDNSDSNEINLGEQLEGAFLLSKKNSVKASAIGRLIGVNLIDDALRVSLTDLRNKKNKKNIAESNLMMLKEELIKYEYLDDLNIKLSKLVTIKDNIKRLDSKMSKLIDINLELNNLKKEKYIVNSTLSKVKDISKLDYTILNLNELIFNHKELNNKKIVIQKIKLEILEKESISKSLKNIDHISSICWNIENLGKKYEKLKTLNVKSKEVCKIKKKESNILNLLQNINVIENKKIYLEEKLLYLIRLKSYNENKHELEYRINKGESYLLRFEKIEDIVKINYWLENKTTKHNKLILMLNSFENIKKKYIIENKVIKENDEHIYKLKILYKNTLEKMEVCPVCYSDIDENIIKKIIDNS